MKITKDLIEVKTTTEQLTDEQAVDSATSQDGTTAYKTFMSKDIEHSTEKLIPFHAIKHIKVSHNKSEQDIVDDTCNSDTEPTPEPDAPIISGVDDITIAEGDTFDPMDGVSAVDSEGNPVEVTVEGTVDTETPGTYTLTYTATDSDGRTTTVTRTVTVAEKSTPIINGANDVTINQGVGINLKDGVTATLDGEDIEFTVDPETIEKCEVGEHEVTYTATGNGKTTTVTRKVTIEQIANPTISGLTDLTVEVGEEFDPLEGVTAKDGNGNDVEVEIVQPETKTIVEGGSANYTGGYGDIPVRTGMWLGELEQNETYRLKFHDLIVNGENKGDEFEVEITREQLAIGYDFGEYRYFRLLNQDPYAYVGTESDVEEGSYPISFSAFVVTTI